MRRPTVPYSVQASLPYPHSLAARQETPAGVAMLLAFTCLVSCDASVGPTQSACPPINQQLVVVDVVRTSQPLQLDSRSNVDRIALLCRQHAQVSSLSERGLLRYV